jgi:DNA polymerase
MPILLRDFETRSVLNLGDVGVWKYSRDPQTDIWCCAFAVDDGPVKLWVPGDPAPAEFIEAASNPDWVVSAFNDSFERLIELHIMGPRYGWPTVPLERHHCVQAAALSWALPAKLEKVALALGLEHQKDVAGAKNMQALAKPRKPRVGEDPARIYWHDDPERLERLYAYSRQDVEVERELHARVGFLSPAEQAVWLLSEIINDRGVYVDVALAKAAVNIGVAFVEKIVAELAEITEGEITSANQTQRLVAWLAAHGCEVKNLQKGTLHHALRRKEILPECRRILELRLAGSHAAASKFETMLAWANDARVRHVFKYHGTHTGRWASHGPQFQNLKRPTTEDMSAAIEAVSTGNYDVLRAHYAQPLAVLGDVARAAVCAKPGCRLIAADLSGIESRPLAS